ncbi:Cysteine-rich repeat secretory protein 38 [Bienertia sinuspersici]
MYYSQIISIIFLIPFTLFLHNTLAIEEPLYQICSSTSKNFTFDTPYQNNLNKLLAFLQYKTPPTGFSLTSIGKNPSKVYGLSLCRGDVNASDCNACVLDASAEIRKRCPYNKGANIWYDNCMLKYSNQDFFGKIDLENRFCLCNVQNISNNPSLFNKKVKELLSKLAGQSASSRKHYAASEMKLDMFTDLYGLAQCTRDLSSKDCKVCLDEAISKLPSCCGDKQGGRLVGGSCNVRYEIYPFVNS